MLNFWEGSRLGLVGINQLPMFKHEVSEVCLATDLIAQQEAMTAETGENPAGQ